MDKYVCIHGHFYQPPRENPWLEEIERQDSADPYHDWNERITAECYAPNGRARILDHEGRIVELVNNYARISFDFGPTLLSWLEKHAPEVYSLILAADKESQDRFSGHGSALAQAYNHMILPLANLRDRRTQVLWGIRDFRHRFGRGPEGMWLPETAVDNQTLEILAEQGIRFTILAPHQAKQARRIGRAWHDASGGKIDTSRPYLVPLRSGRVLSVFFYDGAISRAVAFERLLDDGKNFSNSLRGGFSESKAGAQVVNIATDGETYGHHHPHGDMALASALRVLESSRQVHLTNYGEYLEKFPPTHEVQTFPGTSWSCDHGLERWRGNCGCNSGAHPGWGQQWRAPLREALDWLRDSLAPEFERVAGSILKDPWAARDHYIEVILDRSPANVRRFLADAAEPGLSEREVIIALKLLELQRHAMLMFTSCGWFFDELSGLETVQVLQYAGRALQLARETLGSDLEEAFLKRLERAPSNLPGYLNGRRVYETLVRPAVLDLENVAAHHAVSLLFDGEEHRDRVYCYSIRREEPQVLRSGETKVVLGQLRVISETTLESGHFTFVVAHLGEDKVIGGTRRFRGAGAFARLAEKITESAGRGDSAQLIRQVGQSFGSTVHSLSLLFRDELHRVANKLVEAAVFEAELLYSSFCNSHLALFHAISKMGTPLPPRLQAVLALALNSRLRQILRSDAPDMRAAMSILGEIRRFGIDPDAVTLEFVLRRNMEDIADRMRQEPLNLDTINLLIDFLNLLPLVPVKVNLWQIQNIYYDLLENPSPSMRVWYSSADHASVTWVRRFRELGEKLGMRVPANLEGTVPLGHADSRRSSRSEAVQQTGSAKI
jgi:alpha-amylase/alpha-mannosidase (GH57 family)